MTVIHDWPDTQAIDILRAVRAAARPTSRLLIIDSVVDDDAPNSFVTDVDIAMLAITGGLERTSHQLADLLTTAGFTLTATTSLHPAAPSPKPSRPNNTAPSSWTARRATTSADRRARAVIMVPRVHRSRTLIDE
jgi:hypothetical protein